MQSDSTVLGSVTIHGLPEQVSAARRFVRRVVAPLVAIDSETVTLLTSELVTNAIQHTTSGGEGGTVTIVVAAVSDGVLVEVIDSGSPGIPVVKGDSYAQKGHGLFLVQQLAGQWGYLRHPSGTTVWFHLPFIGCASLSDVPPGTGQRLTASRVAAMTPAQIAPRSPSSVT